MKCFCLTQIVNSFDDNSLFFFLDLNAFWVSELILLGIWNYTFIYLKLYFYIWTYTFGIWTYTLCVSGAGGGAPRRRRRFPKNSLHLVGPWEHHAQEPNIPFGESLTSTIVCQAEGPTNGSHLENKVSQASGRNLRDDESTAFDHFPSQFEAQDK